MTQKMIQIDVDKMKKELSAIRGYYGSSRVISRGFAKVASEINNNKPIDAYKELLDLQQKQDKHYENLKTLTKMLTDAGCVLD